MKIILNSKWYESEERIMKNDNIFKKYGYLYDIIEEINIENITSFDIFDMIRIPKCIKVIRIYNSVFDVNSIKNFLFKCRKSIQHIIFI